MREPKPLEKEILRIIEAAINEASASVAAGRVNDNVGPTILQIKRLLAAEQYWREAVKQVSEPFITDKYGNPDQCDYCGAVYRPDPKWTGATYMDPACHAENCPWLLAWK